MYTILDLPTDMALNHIVEIGIKIIVYYDYTYNKPNFVISITLS